MPSPPAPSVVIGLADNLLATALVESLAQRFTVLPPATSWCELEDRVEAHSPSVVLIDVLVGPDKVMAHLSQLVVAHKESRFVICSADPGDVLIERALLAGAAGIVDHAGTVEHLAAVVVAVFEGKPWPEGYGIPALESRGRPAPIKPLSPRVRQAVELFWLGKTHAEAAEILGVSLKTVEAISHEARVAYGVPRRIPAPWEPKRRRGRGASGK